MPKQNKRQFDLYVVKIIDKSTLIINYGSDDNEEYYRQNLDEFAVKVGDKVKIVSPGPMVVDPLTKKELGYFDKTKEVLEITELYPKMAVCQKIRRETQSTPSPLAVLSNLQTKEIVTTEILTINVEESEIEPIDVKKTKIKIGDPVLFIN